MMEAVRTSETSVDNHFTRQYIPDDNSEHRNNLCLRRESYETNKYKIRGSLTGKVDGTYSYLSALKD
jgi:hypothetical protein